MSATIESQDLRSTTEVILAGTGHPGLDVTDHDWLVHTVLGGVASFRDSMPVERQSDVAVEVQPTGEPKVTIFVNEIEGVAKGEIPGHFLLHTIQEIGHDKKAQRIALAISGGALLTLGGSVALLSAKRKADVKKLRQDAHLSKIKD